MVIDDLEFRAEARLTLSADDATGVLADIGPYFRRQETRRMVVLGDAGAPSFGGLGRSSKPARTICPPPSKVSRDTLSS